MGGGDGCKFLCHHEFPFGVGGRTARDPLEGEGVETIADAVRALTLECEGVGEDLLVSARMKEW